MKRIMIYDSTQQDFKEKYLSLIWKRASLLGKFDYVFPVTTVGEMLKKLQTQAEACRIEDRYMDIQLWGHGSEARFYVDRTVFDSRDVASLTDAVGDRVKRLWFRSCDTFRGSDGQALAKQLARALKAEVAGHTRVISLPFVTHQSGLYALRPDQNPGWNKDDAGYSTPWKPHTILTSKMTLPEWAFDH